MNSHDLLILVTFLFPFWRRAFDLSFTAIVYLLHDDPIVLDDVEDDLVHVIAIVIALSITITVPDTQQIDKCLLAPDRWVWSYAGAGLVNFQFVRANHLVEMEVSSMLTLARIAGIVVYILTRDISIDDVRVVSYCKRPKKGHNCCLKHI